MAISLPTSVFCVFSRSWGCFSRAINWVMIVVVSSPLISPSTLVFAISPLPLLDCRHEAVDDRQHLLRRRLADHDARPAVDEADDLDPVGAQRVLDPHVPHVGRPLRARARGAF